ncbi:MAG: PFL family protein [Lentisphaerae bacterium]|nr:PFL family protein [Lentisphaerota bacterium]
MHRSDDILDTVRMLQQENLDLRTVTLGINLLDCAGRSMPAVTEAVRSTIATRAGNLIRICDQLATKYGLPIINKRIAVSPASQLLEGHPPEAALALAQALDHSAKEVGVDLIGGFTALVHKGMTPGERLLIESLPQALSRTKRLCASVNIGTTRAGMNVDAILLVSETILKIAEATRQEHGFGCAKLVVFANAAEDNPFMAGAFLGPGEPDCVINVGVSGPGVVKRAIERLVEQHPACTLDEIAEEIKHTAFRITRTGELIGREVAEKLGVRFGVLDLSLAPTPRVGDSVGEIYQAMGVRVLGAPGTTAAVALLNDAVKKGGAFASSAVGGLSGAFLPVMEDHALAQAVAEGTLTLEKLEAMTAVCSVGLDMILVPGDIDSASLSGIIMDEAAIGIYGQKTTAVRIIPAIGHKAGERIDFGGLFGAGTVMSLKCASGSAEFVRHGGHIPAPIQSLGN